MRKQASVKGTGLENALFPCLRVQFTQSVPIVSNFRPLPVVAPRSRWGSNRETGITFLCCGCQNSTSRGRTGHPESPPLSSPRFLRYNNSYQSPAIASYITFCRGIVSISSMSPKRRSMNLRLEWQFFLRMLTNSKYYYH